MNKKKIAYILIGVLVLGGIIFILSQAEDKDNTEDVVITIPAMTETEIKVKDLLKTDLSQLSDFQFNSLIKDARFIGNAALNAKISAEKKARKFR